MFQCDDDILVMQVRNVQFNYGDKAIALITNVYQYEKI